MKVSPTSNQPPAGAPTDAPGGPPSQHTRQLPEPGTNPRPVPRQGPLAPLVLEALPDELLEIISHAMVDNGIFAPSASGLAAFGAQNARLAQVFAPADRANRVMARLHAAASGPQLGDAADAVGDLPWRLQAACWTAALAQFELASDDWPPAERSATRSRLIAALPVQAPAGWPEPAWRTHCDTQLAALARRLPGRLQADGPQALAELMRQLEPPRQGMRRLHAELLDYTVHLLAWRALDPQVPQAIARLPARLRGDFETLLEALALASDDDTVAYSRYEAMVERVGHASPAARPVLLLRLLAGSVRLSPQDRERAEAACSAAVRQLSPQQRLELAERARDLQTSRAALPVLRVLGPQLPCHEAARLASSAGEPLDPRGRQQLADLAMAVLERSEGLAGPALREVLIELAPAAFALRNVPRLAAALLRAIALQAARLPPELADSVHVALALQESLVKDDSESAARVIEHARRRAEAPAGAPADATVGAASDRLLCLQPMRPHVTAAALPDLVRIVPRLAVREQADAIRRMATDLPREGFAAAFASVLELSRRLPPELMGPCLVPLARQAGRLADGDLVLRRELADAYHSLPLSKRPRASSLQVLAERYPQIPR